MSFRGQDAWRKHPIFRWGFTDALPGLREGAVLFGLYMGGSWAYEKLYGHADAHAHGAGGHGAAHGGSSSSSSSSASSSGPAAHHAVVVRAAPAGPGTSAGYLSAASAVGGTGAGHASAAAGHNAAGH